MKNFCKKIKAFTLAEVAIVFMVLAIIAAATIKITKAKSSYYLNKFMYYSAFENLKLGIAELIITGCTSSDISSGYCPSPSSLPTVAYTTAGSRSLCARLVEEEFNTTGSVDCSLPASDATDFKTATPNFITTNGMRFFNFGTDADPTSKIYTVYIDIDGEKRNAVLDEDVMKFIIDTTNKVVLPDASSKGANTTDYLKASIRYLDATNNIVWLLVSKDYRQALCTAGQANTADTAYCDANSTYIGYSKNAACNTYQCEVLINKPSAFH